MAFIHGKDTTIYLGTTDLSSYANAFDVARTSDVAETTTFGKSSKTYVAGMKDGTISMSGFFDATADGTLQTLIGSSSNSNLFGFTGSIALSSLVSYAKGDVTNYGISSPVGDVVAFTLDFQSNEIIDNGLVLSPITTSTASFTGTAVDNSTSTSNGGSGFLIVSAASGTTPTLDLEIQHSADDVTYATLLSFTQATSTTSEIKAVASSTTVNRYLKVSATIGGTTPSFTTIVGFARNN